MRENQRGERGSRVELRQEGAPPPVRGFCIPSVRVC